MENAISRGGVGEYTLIVHSGQKMWTHVRIFSDCLGSLVPYINTFIDEMDELHL